MKNTTLIIHKVVNPELKVTAFVQVWTNKSSSHDKCPFSKIMDIAKEKKPNHKLCKGPSQSIPGLSEGEGQPQLPKFKKKQEKGEKMNLTGIFKWNSQRGRKNVQNKGDVYTPEQNKPKASKKQSLDIKDNHCKEEISKSVRSLLMSSHKPKTNKKKTPSPPPTTPKVPGWRGPREAPSEAPQTRNTRRSSLKGNIAHKVIFVFTF